MLYSHFMISPLLVAYYMHQVTLPASSRVQPVRQPAAAVEAQSSVRITAQSLLVDGSIPPGAQRVPMLRVTIENSCEGSATIFGLELRRRGLGDRRDISAVHAVSEGSRISRSRPISRRNNQVSIPLRQYSVPACKTNVIYIYADFSRSASVAGQHAIELLNVESDATVSMRVQPAQSAVLSTVGSPVGELSVEYLRLHRRIRYGDRRTVARFRIEADSESDHLLTKITLTNQGTARDDNLQNLYLVTGRNRKVSPVIPKLVGDTATLRFDPPLALKRNQSRTFSLMSDVRSGIRRSIQFTVEEPSDIQARPLRRR